jgi:hypothetical protein
MKSLCFVCKGRGWCKLPKCPILENMRQKIKVKARIKSADLFGSSPPSCFVGSYNYPKLNTGVLLPSETGNTSIYDAPKTWFDKKFGVENILRYRSSLINSRRKLEVRTAGNPDRFLESIQEVTMASVPVDVEVKLNKIPRFSLTFGDSITPFGPNAHVEKMRVTENPKIEKKVDYIISDTDLKAQKAIVKLYDKKVDNYRIEKILSIGLIGLKIQRKLVPTRWSITATDDILGKEIMKEIKSFPKISDYLLFESNYIGNFFQVLLLPTEWTFEQIEMGVPGGFWTGKMREPSCAIDYESYFGRKTYAKNVAGGYYAGRLGVLEYLRKTKRQAGVLILREIRPESVGNVGVWKVRETVRAAMSKKPRKFDTLDDALNSINENFMIKKDFWKPKSKILENLRKQKRIAEFFK